MREHILIIAPCVASRVAGDTWELLKNKEDAKALKQCLGYFKKKKDITGASATVITTTSSPSSSTLDSSGDNSITGSSKSTSPEQ